MKHISIISAIVLFVSFSSFAEMNLKIGGGLNLSYELLSGVNVLPDYREEGMHIGYNAGANLEYYFSKQFGVAAGLAYETRGSKSKIITSKLGASANLDPQPQPMEFSLNYLQIPVHFSYRPIPVLAASIGPELGIYVGGKKKVGSALADLTDINTVDFGMSVTADYTFINMIAVGAGYYLGFLNTSSYTGSDGSTRNTNVKIYVAYVLHL